MTRTLEQGGIQLLDVLLRAGEARSLHELARMMGIKSAQLTPMIERLVALGCVLESHPQHGIRLVEAGLNCWSEYLEWRHTNGPGRRTLVYARTASTQDVARQLLRGEKAQGWPSLGFPQDFDGYAILADHQTSGRGRLGRTWHGKPGSGVLMSLIVSRETSTDRLMLASCHAVAETVGRLTGATVAVRWPNDVLVEGRKVAGILVETANRATVVGIGINVRGMADDMPAELRRIAGSLELCGTYVDRLLVIDLLLEQLDEAMHRLDDAALTAAWRRRAEMIQQRITVQTDGRTLTGRVIDIDPAHGLLMEVEGGPVVTLPAATTSLVV